MTYEVSYGLTLQPKQYESIKIEIRITGQPGQTAEDLFNEATKLVHEQANIKLNSYATNRIKNFNEE